MGLLCSCKKFPYYANVQGLGTAFQKPVLSDMVTVMYRTALRKVEKVIFENQANAQEFKKRRILSEEKEVVLHGAGINLKEYRYRFYPNNEKIHFLYLGRIMKEKGMDELFGAIERLRKDGCEFVLDLVGFFEEEYRKKVEHLQKEGIKSPSFSYSCESTYYFTIYFFLIPMPFLFLAFTITLSFDIKGFLSFTV